MNPSSQIRFFDNIYRPRTGRLQVPFDNLDGGTRVLSEEAECDRYIALYGGHHFHKLYAAFPSTNFDYTSGKSVEIIDWGCGQAIATCVLIDYLIEKRINPKIVSITLIEPSSIALWRGYNFVRQMLQANLSSYSIIKTVNKHIDYLEFSDFVSSDSNIKIHLFSNIIDVEGFDLNKLYNLIINCFQGINRVVCTSPYQSARNYRIDTFYNMFCEYPQVKNPFHSDKAISQPIFNVLSGQFETWKIARYERQFTVNL
ncbi:hypothetical protein NIES4075_11760 [Tolypothrix sp. NIES-4075]|uniref:hypothetical protein n=1 Tax=Tolypothrix sp. NIES-4075 TaxID=2005459 RepID=UPI000B5C23AD|nr:hypothetical protein [Tolypothrix sp. NIES-4075]GAX40213.1 hypothetical protein NIES4075_11760 [Tolypothrix sp. NIES-4075]